MLFFPLYDQLFEAYLLILLELGKVSYNYVNYSQHNQANLASEPMTLILLKFYPNHHINY